jgi:adenosylcobinamide-phosphate synthase
VALALAPILAPHAYALLLAAVIDYAIGDPVYRAHPVRIIGRSLRAIESALRALGADGYAGGIALFVLLAGSSLALTTAALHAASIISAPFAWALHLFLVYSFLALGDLLRHGWNIERALRRDDLAEARRAVAQLVGRDTAQMDAAACRRAAVESLSENLTDGFTSAVFWYVVAGIPGIVLFKVVSTMDSMVGYKTARYLRFGWCGARMDDLMNFVPARLTWLLLSIVAVFVPGCSGAKALRIGWQQHAILPGPNSGWSEAAAAGALQSRLVGPIWMNGALVTETWIGDPADPPLATASQFQSASRLITSCGGAATAIGCGLVLSGNV